MVEIVHIRTDNGKITFDCFKEGKEKDSFSMVMDATALTVESSTIEPDIYSRQAAKRVKALASAGILPERTVSYWC